MKDITIHIGVKQLVALGVIMLVGFVFSDWNKKRFVPEIEAREASEKWRTSGIPYAQAMEPSIGALPVSCLSQRSDARW